MLSKGLLKLQSVLRSSLKIKKNSKVRAIAFYLPQFHPIPENDAWWGRGFTEWTNVATAKSLFKGHEQPVIPADLGFYDLRLPETRIAQAEMAREYGVEGFCYWHYWFNGKRLLERPFEEVLTSGSPDFPFCLGWANHSWTGVWKDEPDRKLIDQTYPGFDDDKAHFEYLFKAFKDDRYMTVDGKPIFVIFRPTDMPESKKRFDYWRELAINAGLPGLYIVGVNILNFTNCKALGLDAIIVSALGVVTSQSKIVNTSKRIFWWLKRNFDLGGPQVEDYSRAIKHLIPKLDDFDVEAYPCVYPNWDNTPRKGRKGFVLKDSTPDLFETLLKDAVRAVAHLNDDHKIVFIKSWNEWAEGNYLEPDLKWGCSYLEKIKKVLL